MAGFIIRRKLTVAEATDLVDRARWFFANYPRRRVFRVGDEDGRIWFTVRRAHILDDVNERCVGKVSLLTEREKHEAMLMAYAMDRGRQRQ